MTAAPVQVQPQAVAPAPVVITADPVVINRPAPAPPPAPVVQVQPAPIVETVAPIVREVPVEKPSMDGRLVGERPIGREELYSSGNLIEAPAVRAPALREEMRYERVVQPQPVVTTVMPEPTPVRTYAAAPVPVRTASPARTYAAAAPSYAAPAATYAAPEVATYAAPAPTYTAQAPQAVVPGTIYAAPTELVEVVQPGYSYAGAISGTTMAGAPMTYAVPPAPVAMGGAFAQVDRNHDGVIDRAEFNAAFGGAAVGYGRGYSYN